MLFLFGKITAVPNIDLDFGEEIIEQQQPEKKYWSKIWNNWKNVEMKGLKMVNDVQRKLWGTKCIHDCKEKWINFI